MANTLRDQLQRILEKHVATAVNEAIDAYRAVIAAGLGDSKPSTTSRRPRKTATAKRTSLKRVCPVPGCGKPGKGPRFRFFCEDHRELPKSEQNRILAAAKSGGSNGVSRAAPAPAKKTKRTATKKASGKRKATKKKTAAPKAAPPQKATTESTPS